MYFGPEKCVYCAYYDLYNSVCNIDKKSYPILREPNDSCSSFKPLDKYKTQSFSYVEYVYEDDDLDKDSYSYILPGGIYYK
jgi:hypothetical protein